MSFYSFFKGMAFKMDPERAHVLAMKSLSKFPLMFSEVFSGDPLDKRMKLQVGSLQWDFPVGLAAGLDKNAEAIEFFSGLKFGAVEVGTVTPLAQEGNPKPRMWRYPKEESLRNAMGFNNAGSDEILENITSSSRRGKVLGVNLGKNKVTPEEKAPDDYYKLYEKFHSVADYLVVNVSSPNTPGLRDLQREEGLRAIFSNLVSLREKNPVPLYLKISPDLAYEDLDSIIQIAIDYKLEGLIATNTTIMPDRGAGGVSGRLLTKKAAQMRFEVLKRLKGVNGVEFIGVGGISGFDQVWDFWKAGGRAVQIYSSFIFQGPEILDGIQRETLAVIEKNGLKSLEDLLANIDKVDR